MPNRDCSTYSNPLKRRWLRLAEKSKPRSFGRIADARAHSKASLPVREYSVTHLFLVRGSYGIFKSQRLQVLDTSVKFFHGWTAFARLKLFLGTAFSLHTRLVHSLHFFLAFLECRCHSLSLGWVCEGAKTTATSNADVTELPTRLARLTGYLAVILVRKPFTAPAAPTAVSAATTITTRAAIAGTAARTTRAAGFRFRASFVHLQIAPAWIFAVESSDSLGCIGVVHHFHEAKTAGFSGFAVSGDVDTRQLAKRLEQRLEIRCSGLKTHVADKKILHAHLSLNDLLPLLKRFTTVGLAT